MAKAFTRCALTGALLLLVSVAASSETPHAPVVFSVQPLPLFKALNVWARQARIQLVWPAGDPAEERMARPVMGSYAPEQALTILLDGSGLEYRFLDDETVAIRRTQESAANGGEAAIGRGDQQLSGFRVAQANADPRVQEAAAAQEQGANKDRGLSAEGIQEVVVSAQKRGNERLQDVPLPITVVNTQGLAASSQVELQDYYTRIPGLQFSPGPGRLTVLSLRGISSGSNTTPTVGVLVDDVAFGSSNSAWGNVIPDLDPSDLARVEVLRGPQGTLFGANSMGGLVRFVTVDPSTEGLTGRVQAGTTSVRGGSSLGYGVRGSVNVPLSETMAVRASAFTREDPGYVDNPITGKDALNRARISGGRLSALWRPSDAFSVKLSALLQDDRQDSPDTVIIGPGIGDLQQTFLPGTGAFSRKLQAYSATVTGRIGRVDLTSISGYSVNDLADSFDTSVAHAATWAAPFGVSGSQLIDLVDSRRFTQELRFSTPLGQRWSVLGGVFYSRETSPTATQEVQAVAPSGAIVGSGVRLGNFKNDGSHVEYAAFADLTIQLNDRFDLQLGARQSRLEDEFNTSFLITPLFGGIDAVTPPNLPAKANVFTYLVTPRMKLSPDLMVYGRLASGYRPGGGGPGRPADTCVLTNTPCQFKPDTTRNYEVGIKGALANRVLTYDISLYSIDWTDLQVNLFGNPFTYTTNAGRARSQGVEVAIESVLSTGLAISASASFGQAELTDVPANGPAVSGDRMPFSGRFTGRLALEQEFPVASFVAFVGGELSYVSERVASFISPTTPREVYPAYAKTDLRAGVRRDGWTANFFVNNVTDRRGLLGGGEGLYGNYFFIIQPRTVGVSLAKDFQ